MTRRRWIAIAVVAAVVLALVALRPRRGAVAAAGPSTAPARAAAPRLVAPAPRELPAAALDPGMLSADALRASLDQFMRDSVYPPSSHLWTEDTAHLMGQDWDEPIVSDLGLDDRPGQETAYRFGADRQHVGFGEPLTTWIEVWPAAHPDQRLPVTIRSAVVLKTGGRSPGRTGGQLAYRDDGQGGDAVAGDHVYTNRFVPSEKDELTQAGRVHLSVAIEAGGVERLISRDFDYAPRPLLDLVDVTSGPRDGGLGLALAVDVHEPGLYLWFAEIYGADGVTPIGWITAHWQELAVGRRTVEVALFGKVLRDRGLPGPYVVKGFRAMRRETDDEPEQWWSDPRSHTTAAIPVEEFSAFEWDGRERWDAIAALQKTIAEQAAAEAALARR
ncbi:MAG: hypothetical protein JNK64_30740 [Myxococcales bacterium]|nr:hypothetical protein [Myxococcales bacterium]